MFFFIFALAYYLLRFDKSAYSFLLFQNNLSKRFINRLREPDVLLYLELIYIISIFALFLYWIGYIVYTFLVISFTQYKGYVI